MPTTDAGVPAAQGRIDPSAVRARIRTRLPGVRRCYEQALARNPSLRGRLNVRFVIGRDGRLEDLGSAGGDLKDEVVIGCVVGAFSGMTFPQPEGGSVSVVYPMLLTPDSGASVDADGDAGGAPYQGPAVDTNAVEVPVPSPAQLAEIVHALGRPVGDPFLSGELDQLRRVPLSAARLLVEELKVVSPDDTGPAALHAIWCIRALRTVTGQDFRFKTKVALTARQKQVYLSATVPLAFFRERLVDGRTAIAPRDVQQQIVDAWRAWLNEHGDSFAVPDKVPFWEWYF